MRKITLSKTKFGYTITDDRTKECFAERNGIERPTFNFLAQAFTPEDYKEVEVKGYKTKKIDSDHKK